MKQVNRDFDFDIPAYITEEIEEYEELKKQGIDISSKKRNIIALLELAKFNNKLTTKEVDLIINTYCLK